MAGVTRGFLRTLQEGFSPLRIRNLRIYLSGQTVSLVGTFMQSTAQSWVVYDLSHSSTALGITVMLGFLPLLILSPWTGVWADRLDRRRVLLGTQVAAMLLAFTLALLVQTHLVQLWHIFLLAALLGTVNALDLPTQQAFIGDLSGMDQVRKAVVTNSMIIQIARTVGPAVGGVAVGVLGAALAFWINGASFLAVLATLLMVRATQTRLAASGGALGDFRRSLRFIRGHPRVLDLVLFTAMVAFFAMSTIFIFPAVTAEVFHGSADLYGLLLGSSGAGALVGSIILTPLAQGVRRTGLVLAGATLWTAAWLLLFASTASFPLAATAVFFTSLTIPVVLTTANGLMQVLAPPDMRARLLSTLLMVSFGVQPLAAVVTGLDADLLGTQKAVAINGGLLLLGALLMLLIRPGLRAWEAAREALPQLPAVALVTASPTGSGGR